MKNDKKLSDYEAPQVRIICVAVERGFANSIPTGGENGHWVGLQN